MDGWVIQRSANTATIEVVRDLDGEDVRGLSQAVIALIDDRSVSSIDLVCSLGLEPAIGLICTLVSLRVVIDEAGKRGSLRATA